MNKDYYGRFFVAFGIVFVLGAIAALVIPQLGKTSLATSETPPALVTLAVGLLMTIFTAGALIFSLRAQWGSAPKVLFLAVAYNVLVILIKFILSPMAVYRANQSEPFLADNFILPPLVNKLGQFDIGSLLLTAFLTFALYIAAFGILYLVFRRGVRRELASPEQIRVSWWRRPSFLGIIGAFIAGAVVVASGGAVFLFIFVSYGSEYLGYIFSTSLGVLTAIMLVMAASLAGIALKGAADQAIVIRDAALFSSFFWIGVSFLALYHTLWIVYLFTLAVLWPFRVVLPGK